MIFQTTTARSLSNPDAPGASTVTAEHPSPFAGYNTLAVWNRCDPGYLTLRRHRIQSRHTDGNLGPPFEVDIVGHRGQDGVAILPYARTIDNDAGSSSESGTSSSARSAPRLTESLGEDITVWLVRMPRPAMALRDPAPPPDVCLWEAAAGVLEAEDLPHTPNDTPPEARVAERLRGILRGAARELAEEVGFAISPEQIRFLGPPIAPSPGFLTEALYLTAVDVTGCPRGAALGDGSPFEAGMRTEAMSLAEAWRACANGRIFDAKTVVAVFRLTLALTPALASTPISWEAPRW